MRVRWSMWLLATWLGAIGLASAAPAGTAAIDGESASGYRFLGKKEGASLTEKDGALRVECPKKMEKPWFVGLTWPTVVAVEKGMAGVCDLTMRAVGGKGKVTVKFQENARPYTSYLNKGVVLTDKWQRFAFPLNLSQTQPAGGARLTLHVGLRKQVVEIKDVRVRVFPKGTSRQTMAAAMSIPVARLGRLTGTTDHPLTPSNMVEMGAMHSLDAPKAAFDPSGAWKQRYRIWTNYGYRGKGNKNCGWLEIERVPGGKGGDFTLRVREHIDQAEGGAKDCEATMACRADAMASLREWTLKSIVSGPTDAPLASTPVVEKGKGNGGKPTTSHWALFEAVQRLPFESGKPVRFDMLEELDLKKPDQEIVYRGKETVNDGKEDVELHRFDQVGRGILPFEYWVDDNHRLRVVTTFCRAYILDEKAGAEVSAR